MNIIYKTIYYIFIVAIALVALLLVASAIPIPGGIKTFVVQSGSMEPKIKTGSIVVVKPASNYKIGDIITFGPTSKIKPPTTHRITEIKDGKYFTKGDANNANDVRTVSKYDIIGKVYLTVPYVGYAVAAAKKPWGFAVIIVIPAVIIIYDEIRKIVSEAKRIKTQKQEASSKNQEEKKE